MPTPPPMRHRRTPARLVAPTMIALGTLVHFTGCASEPSAWTEPTGLPDVPLSDQGIGLDGRVDEAQRLDDPERPTLPEVPETRNLPDYLNNANRTATNAAPIYDIDQAIDNASAANGTRDAAPTTPGTTTPQASPTANHDPLLGAPAHIFATVEDEPELDEASDEPLDVLLDLDDLLRRLERLTGDEALASPMPLAPALRAGALEALDPGALDRAIGSLGPDAPFTPDERALLSAWARMHREVSASGTDPIEVAEALRAAADETSGLLPLRIATLELCKRVVGYGSYEPVYRTQDIVVLSAGAARSVVVYAEIDRFEAREKARAGIEGFEVDLKQTIELVHLDRGDGAADLIAWGHPEQRITDFSRNRRRDFYTTQIITLPSTLSIGRYHLRLTVKDAVSDEQAQSIVPIDVVALTDPENARATP